MQPDLKQLHERFLYECEVAGGLRKDTLRGYAASFYLLNTIIENLTLEKLVPETIISFFNILRERKRPIGKGRIVTGMRNSSIATYWNKLDKFFKWLKQKGFINNDPFEGLPYPKVKYTDRKYLKKQDLEKIFTAITLHIDWSSPFISKRNIAIYTVLLYCGLRKGELIGLKMLDIDFDRLELRVRAETSKSDADRYVPLHPKVISALKEYLYERRKLNFNTAYLWVSEVRDDKFTLFGLSHLNKRIEKVSGVDFHLHQFRHTFAMNLAATGCDPNKLMQLMGHVDIRMTAAYLRCMPNDVIRKDVQKLCFDDLL